jgi:hypothetical protein
MREAQIRARAIPELRIALEAREITLYRGGEIARLPADRQGSVLAQWVNRFRSRNEGQTIAVRVIREELSRRSEVDLARVASAIKNAVSQLVPSLERAQTTEARVENRQ